jgi:hypothetical protein
MEEDLEITPVPEDRSNERSDELALLKNNPVALMTYYTGLIIAGKSLTSSQLIKFEYLQDLLVGGAQ